MLAPIFEDPSFNLAWMARNRQLQEAVAQGASSTTIQPYNTTTSTAAADQPGLTQSETAVAVASGAKTSQGKSSTEKSATPDEQQKEADRASEPNRQPGELTREQKRTIEQLQFIDNKVRAHEQAHLNAAQGIAISGANFEYQMGPDKKRYAVAGEVTIDTSREDEPAKTIDKGYKIIRTALAPADPSPQDQSVANYAQQMIYEAQAELMRESYRQHNNRSTGDAGHEIDLMV